ncbi:hypothetical protein DL95DRAFT_467277 [Leptodontidium sp. 2 PMI_412]|nr:hypothetical protein DL95DRAFT_467277 [Leptodontidium sp. 2 PMI_412]
MSSHLHVVSAGNSQRNSSAVSECQEELSNTIILPVNNASTCRKPNFEPHETPNITATVYFTVTVARPGTPRALAESVGWVSGTDGSTNANDTPAPINLTSLFPSKFGVSLKVICAATEAPSFISPTCPGKSPASPVCALPSDGPSLGPPGPGGRAALNKGFSPSQRSKLFRVAEFWSARRRLNAVGVGAAAEVYGVVEDGDRDDDPAVESVRGGAGVSESYASGRSSQYPVGVCNRRVVSGTPTLIGIIKCCHDQLED